MSPGLLPALGASRILPTREDKIPRGKLVTADGTRPRMPTQDIDLVFWRLGSDGARKAEGGAGVRRCESMRVSPLRHSDAEKKGFCFQVLLIRRFFVAREDFGPQASAHARAWPGRPGHGLGCGYAAPCLGAAGVIGILGFFHTFAPSVRHGQDGHACKDRHLGTQHRPLEPAPRRAKGRHTIDYNYGAI